MLLLKGCVDTLYAYDRSYKIVTNARYWLGIGEQFNSNDNESDKVMLLFDCLVDTDITREPEDYQIRLLERIKWFYSSEYEVCNNFATGTQTRKGANRTNSNIAYSFEIDGGRIFSAFYKTYHIDIEKELDTLHWWKFMAMFNDLSIDSNFKGFFTHYRNYDKNSSEYRESKPETKRIIDEQINRVLITSNNFEVREQAKSKLDILREKAKVPLRNVCTL